MQLKHTSHYKTLTLSDKSLDIKIEENQKINNKIPGSFSVFKAENQMILKVVKNGKTSKEDIIFKYSNKGNISAVIYTDNKGIRIKKIYDYTSGSKELCCIKYFKGYDYIKCEKYKNNTLKEIVYYANNIKYCCEFFSDDIHPFKVEYYNCAGLKV